MYTDNELESHAKGCFSRCKMRSEFIDQLVRSFGVILSKRAGFSVGLWGEPGIGKSFTVRAILQDVSCQHLSLHATTPAASIARALPRPKKLPTWAERQLQRLENAEQLEPEALANTIAVVLAGLAPFVLYLEDLHEANPERLEVVGRLALAVNQIRGAALIVTSRIAPPEGFKTHRLGLLEADETTVMLERELGASLPAAGLEWIQSRTHGNPLFALEFLRYLTRQGFLWSDGKRWNWRAPSNDFVPITVEALIGQLTSSLRVTSQTQAVLEARAILPSELEAEQLNQVWANVAGLDLRSLERSRIDLERVGLLRGQSFAHPLFGEVIMRDLPASQRQFLARRALEALETVDLALAAGFIKDAGLGAVEAVDRLERAARQLLAAGNPIKAAHLLASAAGHSSGARQASLALEAAKHFQDRHWPECERLSRLAMRDPTHRQEATFLCATTIMLAGDFDGAWALLESLPAPERVGLEWWQVCLGIHAWSEHNRETVRLWDEFPAFHQDASARSVSSVIKSLVNLGEIERAKRLIDVMLARADLTVLERANILNHQNAILYREAHYEAIERNLTGLIEAIDASAFPGDCAAWYANRSNARVRLNKMLEARLDAEQACKLYLSTGALKGYAKLLTRLSLAQIYLGEFEQAEQVLLEAVSSAQHHEPEILDDCYGHLSFLYLRWKPAHGQMLSRRYAHLALEASRNLDRIDSVIGALEDCVRAELGCKAPERALGFARELEALAEQTGLDQDLVAAAALMGRSLAALGDQAARVYLRRASELYEAHGQHSEALSHELEIDRLENNVQAAKQKLEWFAAHGDSHHVARVVTYFPQLGQTPEPNPDQPPASRIKILGPIQLEHDGQIVITRARKRLEIIAYLLEARIAGRSEVGTLDLLDTFYPNETESQGKNTLKQKIYEIRASLGPESVHSTTNGYALGAVSSDAEEFLKNGDSSLWRGVYLEGLGEGWISSVRDALTLALRSKLEALLATDHSELTQPELTQLNAARLGRILCDLEPYDPDVLRLTIRALRASGDDRAAQRFFAEHRTLMLEMNEPIPPTLEAFLIGQA
jgi:DNA-binding SARP family transcriptional activator/tetratricopeptide (TPR) repeat protein